MPPDAAAVKAAGRARREGRRKNRQTTLESDEELREKRDARETVLAFLFFFVITCAFTFPLILRMHRAIIGDAIDPLLNNWIITHGSKSIFTSPSGFFQGNILYPARDVITYSEHFFTLALLTSPVYYLTKNPLLSYNLLVFFSFVFSALGAFQLVRYLTHNTWAGLLAGVFFAFTNFKFTQITHLNAFFSAFLPYTVLYFHKFWKEGRKRHLLLFFAFFLAQILESWYYFVYVTIIVGLLLIACAWQGRRDFPWKKFLAVVLAMAICLLLLSPFAFAYWRTHQRLPDFERSLEESEMYGARPQDFRTALQNSVLYGNSNPLVRAVNGGEKVLFTGLVILFLACAGVYLLLSGRGSGDGLEDFRRESRGPAAAYLFAAFIILLFMPGPWVAGVKNYFYLAFYRLGLLKFTRVPARFFVPFSLCLAVLGGIGMRGLLLSRPEGERGLLSPRSALGMVLVFLLLAELAVYGLPFVELPTGKDLPAVYRWLREQGDVRVIELPLGALGPSTNYDSNLEVNPVDTWTYLQRESMCAYWSIFHGRTIANGYTHWPYSYRRIASEMQGFPSPRTVEMLAALKIDLVIWHWDWVPEGREEDYRRRLGATAGLVQLEDFGEEEVFSVRAAGAVVPAERLEVRFTAPARTVRGGEVGCGLLVNNPGERSYVYLDEGPHRLRARWRDGGRVVREEESKFWPPFYLAPGDGFVVPVSLAGTPPEGEYLLEVEFLDWPRASTQETGIVVEEGEGPAGQAAVANRSLVVPRAEVIEMEGVRGGLIPFGVEVENAGYVSWKAGERSGKEVGPVYLMAEWKAGAREERIKCPFPCDLSPGQSVGLPFSLRLPEDYGSYELLLAVENAKGERLCETRSVPMLLKP